MTTEGIASYTGAIYIGCDNPAKKILVVDDDDDTRELWRAVLEQHSFEVNEAADTHQALEKIQSWEPDLVTTDIGRPDDSGLVLLRLIKDRRPSLPVVFVTAQGSYRETCLADGAADFIRKPCEPEQLVEVVIRALSEKRPFR